jgi:dolichol-phosphate mannosyltransferase
MLWQAHREKPLDAIALNLHGAGVADSYPDADGEIIRAVREKFGKNMPIGVVLDLHANVTDEMLELCDLLIGVKCYPHVDEFESGRLMFGKLADMRESLEQVSIRTIYIESNRTSHFRPVRDTVRIYRGLFGGRFLKFIGSSFAGFFVDNGVFTLLLCALAPLALDRSVDILISILVARVISASVNYLLNRHFVFRSKNRQSLSICRYAALACAVMALSYAGTFLVSTVFNACGVRITGIKIVVDLILFLLSYKLQKTWVFR